MVGVVHEASSLTGSLKDVLLAPDIQPGDPVSYTLCKTLLLYHPLGLKMTRSPVVMAMAKPREISVPDGPEEHCVKAFEDAWRALDVDNAIKNGMTLARAYGVAAIALVEDGVDPAEPLDLQNLGRSDITFNVLDPLNVSGSMVSNQDPNSSAFMRSTTVRSNGVVYHKSRTIIIYHEQPIYLGYTVSGFGYVGRSVYQRALYPLKTYIETMVTDDLVVRKVGVLVAKLKAVGSIVDQMVSYFNTAKRQILKEAQTGNVINISTEEDVETLNMQNAEGPMQAARKNVVENIATAADMPAKILNQETFAEGFGEGTEDAKNVIRYLEGLRNDMAPVYEYFDRIVKYRAWNPEFFQNIQRLFPTEYGGLTYEQAFYRWSNSFAAQWPSLMEEPESEKVQVEKAKFETVSSMLSLLLPEVDPENKGKLIEFACQCVNSSEHLFPAPLDLDIDALVLHAGEKEQQEREQQKLAAQAQSMMPGAEPPGALPAPATEEPPPPPRPKLITAN